MLFCNNESIFNKVNEIIGVAIPKKNQSYALVKNFFSFLNILYLIIIYSYYFLL